MSCSKIRLEGGRIKLAQGSSSIMMMMMVLPDCLLLDEAVHMEGDVECGSADHHIVCHSE